MKIAFLRYFVAVSCAALLLTQSAQAMPVLSPTLSGRALHQQQTAAAAPIPSDLLQARKVYLQGKDSSPEVYAEFFAEMKAWGYYTFVNSPEQADVIFNFRDQPLSVVIVQPLSNVVLWTVATPVTPMRRRSAQTADLQIQALVSSIKQLSGATLTPQQTESIMPPVHKKRNTLIAVLIVAGSLATAGVVVALLHGRGHQ